MGRLSQIENRFRVISNMILSTAIGSLLLLFIWNVINHDVFYPDFKTIFVNFGGPIIVATMLLIAIGLKPSIRINITLMLVAITIPIYVAEYLISDRARVDGSGLIEHNGSLTKIELISAMRSQEKEVWPSFSPYLVRGLKQYRLNTDKLLPLGGIANVWTVFCNEGNRIAYYKSDKYGFNNAPGSWGRKIKLMILGDSFMQGVCVKQNSTTGGVLRSRGLNTVSLGMVGNGPLSELAGLREYMSGAKPEYVIWTYFEGNDLDDLRSESSDPLLRKYLDEAHFSQNLTQRVSEIGQVLRYYAKQDGTIKRAARYSSPLLSWYKLRALRVQLSVLVQSRFRFGKQPQKYPELDNNIDSRRLLAADLKLFSRVLAVAKQESEDHGVKLLFVYLPSWQSLTGNGDNGSYRNILGIVASMKIPSIDVTLWFKKYDDPLSLFTKTPVEYGHYSERGYELVSSAIAEAVRK